MSITDKLTTIAENMQGVYGKGFTDGKAVDFVRYAVRNPDFKNVKFPENARDVKLTFDNITELGATTQWFVGTNATSLTVIGKNITTLNMFYSYWSSADLKFIDLSQCGNGVLKTTINASLTFAGCVSLERIICEMDFSLTTQHNNPFQNCTALKEFRVTPLTINIPFQLNTSPELSAETIQSVIDGLVDLTGQTKKTITWHSTVMNKLTVDQLDQMTAKNWAVK